MVMYADDTTFYCNLGDLSEDIINNELTKVNEWLAANKLSLNFKKTKYMVFPIPQRKVTYPKIKKITGIVGLLWRLKDLHLMTVLRMLYNSLILPNLSYGILTWGAEISGDDKLHLIQNAEYE